MRATIRSLLTATVLASTYALTPASAQQGAPPVPVKHLPDEPHRQASAPPQDRRGGPREGVRVHGHWTLEVRNADGSVAGRYEFENSLVPGSGASQLPLLLTGQNAIAGWAINVSGSPNLCLTGLPPQLVDCRSDNVGAPDGANQDLSVVVLPSAGGTAAGLQIKGSVKIQSPGQISSVSTGTFVCHSYDNVNDCRAALVTTRAVPFTSRDLSASGIVVAAGQTVLVTVVISFS